MADDTKPTPLGMALSGLKRMLAVFLRRGRGSSDFAESTTHSLHSETPYSLEPAGMLENVSQDIPPAEDTLQAVPPLSESERALDPQLDAVATSEGEIPDQPERISPEPTGDAVLETVTEAVAPTLLTDWRTRAWQGDQGALQEGLDQVLETCQARVAEIATKGNCLQISVEDATVPDQDAVVPLLSKTVRDLNLSGITRLEIFGQKIAHELPFWMAQVELDDPSWNTETAEELGGAASANGNDLATQNSEQLLADYGAGQRNFAKSDWGAVQLAGACLNLVNFQESHLVWANFQGASLWQANFSGARLRHADLSGTNLQGAKLNGADLRSANLRGANLSWAHLQGANLTDADLTDANLHQAQLEHVIMPDGTHLD